MFRRHLFKPFIFKNKQHESYANGLLQLLCFHFSKIPQIARVILSVIYFIHCIAERPGISSLAVIQGWFCNCMESKFQGSRWIFIGMITKESDLKPVRVGLQPTETFLFQFVLRCLWYWGQQELGATPNLPLSFLKCHPLSQIFVFLLCLAGVAWCC